MTTIAQEAARYLSLVDLTSLNLDDTEENIRALCAKACAAQGPTAAVCVYPKWIQTAKECLAHSPHVTVATVINFPEGSKSAKECSGDIETAKSAMVDEIDFVIDWRRYKTDQTFLREYVDEMVRCCKPCVTKVILETSELTPDEIRSAARTCISCGVDFLKTSTGKVKSGGATVEAVKIFAEEIKAADRIVGVKPSGGIKSLEDCRNLWHAVTDILGCENYTSKTHFRFGASGVRDQLFKFIDSTPNKSVASNSEGLTTEASAAAGEAENY